MLLESSDVSAALGDRGNARTMPRVLIFFCGFDGLEKNSPSRGRSKSLEPNLGPLPLLLGRSLLFGVSSASAGSVGKERICLVAKALN